MARFLKPVPEEVALQAMTNKTLNADHLREAGTKPSPDVDVDDLIVLATDVSAPELVPYEYAYSDLLTDGDGGFFVLLNERFHRRSMHKSLGREDEAVSVDPQS